MIKMPKGVYERTPEHCAIMSAVKMGHSVSDVTKKKLYDIEHANPQTGEDIIKHHYIYDHANPEKYTMEVMKSKHAKIHWWMKKAGMIVPHINITEENKNVFKRIKYTG